MLLHRKRTASVLAALTLLTIGTTSVAAAAPSVNDSPTLAADGTWKRLSVTGVAPSERSAPSVTALGRTAITLFGGVHDSFATGQNTFYNDLYRLAFDPSTGTGSWTKVAVTGESPTARAFAGSAGDSYAMFIFGGSQFSADGSQFTVFDDLWKFGGRDWAKEEPVNAGPSGRSGPTVWIDGGKIYVYGGIDATFTTLNDLWSYDLGTKTWKQLVAAGDPGAPPARHLAQAGHTATNGTLTLYGGEGLDQTGFSVLPDTWQYDIASGKWANVTPATGNIDPPRNYGAAGLIGGSLYLQGGDIPGGSAGCGAPFEQNPTEELWKFDTVAKTWRKLAPAGDPLVKLKRTAGAVAGSSLVVTAGWDFQCAADGTGPGQVWNKDTYIFTP